MHSCYSMGDIVRIKPKKELEISIIYNYHKKNPTKKFIGIINRVFAHGYDICVLGGYDISVFYSSEDIDKTFNLNELDEKTFLQIVAELL